MYKYYMSLFFANKLVKIIILNAIFKNNYVKIYINL